MTLDFLKPRLLDDGEQTDYAAQIEALKDDDLVEEIRNQVYEAGFSPRVQTHHDQRCTLLYHEAVRREKTWIYCRGHNKAVLDAGGEVDESDRQKAREPIAA